MPQSDRQKNLHGSMNRKIYLRHCEAAPGFFAILPIEVT